MAPPFHNAPEAAEREFAQQLPGVSFQDNAVNNQPEHFKHALKCLVEKTFPALTNGRRTRNGRDGVQSFNIVTF